MTTPRATHDHVPGEVSATLEFLKRLRAELREIHKVRVWKDHIHIIDVNKDFFELRHLGYLDAEVVPVLQNINTAFNPESIHNPVEAEYKEFGAGRHYTWAHDRVM